MLLFWLVDWWPRSLIVPGFFCSMPNLLKRIPYPPLKSSVPRLRSSVCHPLATLVFLLWTGVSGLYGQPARYTISGYIYEEGSRESLIGVHVLVADTRLGTTTNQYGFYSITLPSGSYKLIFSYVGYQPSEIAVELDQNRQLDLELSASLELTGVEVSGEMAERINRSVQMSRINLPVAQTRAIPALLGEKDLFKVLQLLPGVQKGQEGTSGFYVRGGGPDQNLVILDDATVYNASHLFGFFSIFNGDAIKNVQLYKGGFPARFGGRLSSVLDISMKDGSKEKIQGEAGLGLVSSRLSLEGPIIQDRSSFLLSGRRTYIDALIMPFVNPDERGGYFFYDLNAKANYDIDRNNRLYVSGYFGRDKFFFRSAGDMNYRDEGGMFWQNTTTTLRWNHLFSDRLFANLSFIYSDYTLNIYMEEQTNNNRFELSYSSGIEDIGLKYDLSWSPLPNHLVRAGLQTTYHRFTPSAVVLQDDFAGENIYEVETIRVLESGLYLEDEIRIGDLGMVHPGIRISHFLQGTKSYLKAEPRLSLLYFLRPEVSWKGSFASMNQYVHLLSSTGIGLPTDLWVPSTRNIQPQSTWQVATGLSKDFSGRGLELSLEAYYKESHNTIGYRPGASFLLVGDPSGAEQMSWEDNITAGEAWSYGLELFLQKKTGRLSGWAGYTLSWTKLRFDDLNQGDPFFARYDRRHDLSLVGIWEVRQGTTLSATWVYASGNAMNLPIAEYEWVTHDPWGSGQAGSQLPDAVRGTPFVISPWNYINDYGDMNAFRAASYHRLDVGVQFHRKSTLFGHPVERTIELSVYNLYNRKNPFFYFMEGGPDSRQLKQVTIFPIIPSASISIKF
jgi:hypothetical protein